MNLGEVVVSKTNSTRAVQNTLAGWACYEGKMVSPGQFEGRRVGIILNPGSVKQWLDAGDTSDVYAVVDGKVEVTDQERTTSRTTVPNISSEKIQDNMVKYLKENG